MTADMRRLAETRLREASALLDAGEPSGAYYLAGCAVECALKACIAGRFAPYEMPEKKLIADAHTHDLERLVDLAELRADLNTRKSAPDEFAVYWAVVKDWRIESRYELRSSQETRDLLEAVSRPNDGIFEWLREMW